MNYAMLDELLDDVLGALLDAGIMAGMEVRESSDQCSLRSRPAGFGEVRRGGSIVRAAALA